MTVSQSGSTYGDNTGATVTPDPSFVTDAGSWTRVQVQSSNTVQVTVSGDETEYSEIWINFPGFDETYYRLTIDTGSYSIWDGSVPGLYAWMVSENGNSVTFNIKFAGAAGDLNDLDPFYYNFIPSQNSASQRGFFCTVTPGTYDRGYLSSMEFQPARSQPMNVFSVTSAGLFTIDCTASPTVTTGPTVEIEGYNEGSPFTCSNWNGFDFRSTGRTDLYAYFGGVLDTLLWVKIT